MKTQIIQLEDHDDTISVRDKMDWSQTPRVLLVWPERGNVLRNRLDLILLERYCSSHGSQLALQTHDPEVIFQAGEAGIPVFQSRRTAQLQPWRKSFREFKRRQIEDQAVQVRDPDFLTRPPKPLYQDLPLWARIPIFILAVIAVLAIAGMLLPSATITVQPEVNQRNLVLPIRAMIGEEQIQIAGWVPVRELSISVEDEQSIPATGSTTLPSEYARGEVLFTNLGEEAVTIPTDTILSTNSENPVQFATTEPGSLAPGPGESIAVKISAIYPGRSGNVLAGQITTISTALEAEVAVSNPLATAGGEDLSLTAPSSADRNRLSRNIVISLKELARGEIARSLTRDDVLLSPDLVDYEILAEEFLPDDESPGTKLRLKEKISFIVHYAAGEDLQSLAEDLVKTQYQGGKFEPMLENIQISQLSSPEQDQPQAYSWRMEVAWSDRKVIDQNEFIQTVLGKNPADALTLLEEKFNLSQPPRIELSPSWWFRIPALPFRIILREGGS